MAEKNKSSATQFEPVRVSPVTTGGKIRVPKVAELVADSIRNRILNGELKEGDRASGDGSLTVAAEAGWVYRRKGSRSC